MKRLFTMVILASLSVPAFTQACTPLGNETSYGSSNTWIGYLYNNQNFTSYSGYVNEGNAASANFDESFGGDYVNYPTNGCAVYTETFSARYKLTKTFSAGPYQFIVGGDDGYRLSLDGGATWVINQWTDQSYNSTAYTVTLSGTYNMVLEYYENSGGNRISFSVTPVCLGTEDQSIYGTGNVWKGYVYRGTNFNEYAGMVTEGVAAYADFDESFGGSNTFYSTSACNVMTEQFSVRYRLQKTFTTGDYIFSAGGDDGYRLSLDGGTTWVINNWGDHGYTSSLYSATLSGTYNMVLEYYENAGGNRVSFGITGSLLPVKLSDFYAKTVSQTNVIHWKTSGETNTAYYQLEKSTDGNLFTAQGRVYAIGAINAGIEHTYSFTDNLPGTNNNYYRLCIVDKDRSVMYSPVIRMEGRQQKMMSVFPTIVAHEPVFITSPIAMTNAGIEIFDMSGRRLQLIKLPVLTAGQAVRLPLMPVSPGSYILLCTSGAAIQFKQVLVFR